MKNFRKAIIKKNRTTYNGNDLKKDDKVLVMEKFEGHSRYSYYAKFNETDTHCYRLTRSEFEYLDGDEETFFVSITRTEYSSKTIEVKAKDRKEAEKLAMEAIGDYEFKESDSEYKVDYVLTQSQKDEFSLSTQV